MKRKEGIPIKSHSLTGTFYPVYCFYTKSVRPLISSSTTLAIELDTGA